MAADYRRKTDTLPTCLSCGSVLYGPFCSQCGQRTSEPITFAGVWRRLRERLLRLDFPFWRTVAGLTTDPGSLTRRYVQGRRKPYVNPVAYALFGAAVLSLVALWPGTDLSAPQTPWGPGPQGEPCRGVLVFCAFAALLVLGPVAWLQRLLHPQQRSTWAETYTFGLFVVGHLALYQALFALLGAFASMIGLAALGAAVVLILAHALGGFYGRSLVAAAAPAMVLALVQVAGVFVLGSLARLTGGAC